MKDKKRYFDIHTDRGCPHRCGFCYNLEFNKRTYRAMSAEKVVGMIEEARKRYGADSFNIVSDNLFVDKKRVHDICSGIIKRGLGIRWASSMRIDTYAHYEEGLLKLMDESGCALLSFGVESGSDRMLNKIQKDITVTQVLAVNEKSRKFRTSPDFYFMIGFPEETEEDIVGTIKLMRAIRKSNKAARVRRVQTFRPYPGTPLYHKCLEMGFKPPRRLEDWVDYNTDEDSKLPWFGRGFKNYMKEVQYFTAHESARIPKKNAVHFIIRMLFKCYCRLRVFGLLHGIRLGIIDFKVFRFLEASKNTIRTRYIGLRMSVSQGFLRKGT